MAAMTEESLRKLCREQELYATPALNEVLYCNFQGFGAIGGLDKYTALRSLFLEGNALQALDGLASTTLTCLYVQSNQISSLQALRQVPNLRTLNASGNRLASLAGVEACPQLDTLVCAANKLADPGALASLAACSALSTLDLQANELASPEVVEVLAGLSQLRSLYIKENPFLAGVRRCRRTLVGRLPSLTYMDDRPIFEFERRTAEAWAAGGDEAEARAAEEHRAAARAREQANFDTLQAMRRQSFQKRRQALGLPPGDSDPFYDTLAALDAAESEAGSEPAAQAELGGPARSSESITVRMTSSSVLGDEAVSVTLVVN